MIKDLDPFLLVDGHFPHIWKFKKIVSSSTLPFKCLCHQSIPVKGQLFVHENIDYQRLIRQQGLVQSSLLWNTNRLRDTAENWAEQDKNTWGLYVLVTEKNNCKAEENRRCITRRSSSTWTSVGARVSADPEKMDILETDAYDKRQRRNMVPENHFV